MLGNLSDLDLRLVRVFLAVVEAGGYADDSLWLEEGRHWRDFARATHPTFWVPRDGGKALLVSSLMELLTRYGQRQACSRAAGARD